MEGNSKTQAFQLIFTKKLTRGNRGLSCNTCEPQNPTNGTLKQPRMRLLHFFFQKGKDFVKARKNWFRTLKNGIYQLGRPEGPMICSAGVAM